MNDGPADLPAGWPTDEHRSRVAARARTLRNRRMALRATAVALTVVVVGGGFTALRDRSGPSPVNVATESSTTSPVRPSAPEIRTAPVPNGWRIVDFADARLAIPPGWTASSPGASTGCAPTPMNDQFVLFDGATPSCPSIVVAPIMPSTLPRRAALTIHGLKLYLAADTVVWIRYAVPELGVTLTVHGAAGPVLDTLTSSARRVVLAAPERVTAVPSDWRTVSFGGVTLQVPPTMRITRLAGSLLPPGACGKQIFADPPTVFVGNGSSVGPFCPFIAAGVVAVPVDGVWISTMPDAFPAPAGPATVIRGVELGGLAVTIDAATDPLLTIRTRLGGAAAPTVIRLGLGPDPTIARTILSSIRATDRSG